MRIWIKDITVITVNEDFDILENSNVYIEGNRIYHVGGRLDGFNPEKIIDGKGKVCMPGLINAHTHIGMSVFRNYGNDVSLETWLREFIWPMEKKLSSEDIKASSELAIAEMIETGTTTFVDMYLKMDEVAESVEKYGLRAILTKGLIHPDQNTLEKETDFYKRWHNSADGRIKVMIAPHAVYTNSREELIREMELAKNLDVGIHIHLNESQTEVENSIRENGLSPLEYAHSLGMIDEKTIAAHCVWLSEKEIEIAKTTGMTMVHNPASNMKLASGFMRAQELLDMGINVALGTDGVSSNNVLDMFEEMKLASLIAKGSTLNPKVLNSKTVIEMATINGAKAIGMERELGRIKKGYLADFIIVDLDNIRHTPNTDVVASMVYSTCGNDVDTTIVDGKILYENKQHCKLNVKKLMSEVSEIFDKLRRS